MLKGYGIGLKKGTDVQLLRKVFGDEATSLLTLTGKDLIDYFNRQKAAIRREKLKAALAQELNEGGLQIAHAKDQYWGNVKPGRSLKASVVIKSSYRKLPASFKLSEVRLLKVAPSDLSGINVEPELKETSLTITPQGQGNLPFILKVPPWTFPFQLGRTVKLYQGLLALDGTASLQPERAIKELGFDSRARIVQPEMLFSFGIPIGYSWLLVGILIAGVLSVSFEGPKRPEPGGSGRSDGSTSTRTWQPW